MSDIPEDVMKRAREVVDARNRDPKWYLMETGVEYIARALMEERAAERERCATIAETEWRKHNTGSGFDSQSARSAAYTILTAIKGDNRA